jgi:hypothetical protein
MGNKSGTKNLSESEIELLVEKVYKLIREEKKMSLLRGEKNSSHLKRR